MNDSVRVVKSDTPSSLVNVVPVVPVEMAEPFD